jgi:hypothetical protein
MKIYEVQAYTTHISENNGEFVSDGVVSPLFSDELGNILDRILDKHEQSSMWYFDKLQGNVPWAYVCFTDELDIAGHIAASRPKESNIKFSPYCHSPDVDEEDFVPKVGTIMIYDKPDLEKISRHSAFFNNIWNKLKGYDENKNWLLLIGTLPEELKKIIAQEDNKELWLTNR